MHLVESGWRMPWLCHHWSNHQCTVHSYWKMYPHHQEELSVIYIFSRICSLYHQSELPWNCVHPVHSEDIPTTQLLESKKKKKAKYWSVLKRRLSIHWPIPQIPITGGCVLTRNSTLVLRVGMRNPRTWPSPATSQVLAREAPSEAESIPGTPIWDAGVQSNNLNCGATPLAPETTVNYSSSICTCL